MKKMKSAETSKNDETNGVVLAGARSAPRNFVECNSPSATFGGIPAARQVQHPGTPTTKKTIGSTSTCGEVTTTDARLGAPARGRRYTALRLACDNNRCF